MTNFGTMRYKHIISVVLWSMFLVACGPDRRVALAEKLMAEKETDSAIAVMQAIKEPQNNLTDRDYALYALRFIIVRSHAPETAVECGNRYIAAAGHQIFQ